MLFLYMHEMKKLLLVGLLVLLSFFCYSQQSPKKPEYRPDWLLEIPQATNSTYLYVVEHAEGETEREALNIAIARVFQTTANRIGQFVSTDEINKAVQVGTDYEVIGRKMKVPIHKACDFSINSNGKWIVYVLCQVAKAGNITPEFDFTHANNMCSKHVIYDKKMDAYNDSLAAVAMKQQRVKNTMIGYSFVPGMAQIKKGSVAKGACFIAGEVVFVGGIVVTECLRQNYAKQISMTNNSTLKKRFATNANICMVTRNVCIAGAVAVYAWNIIDGIVAKDKRQIQLGSTKLDFSPYATPYEGGLALNLTF